MSESDLSIYAVACAYHEAKSEPKQYGPDEAYRKFREAIDDGRLTVDDVRGWLRGSQTHNDWPGQTIAQLVRAAKAAAQRARREAAAKAASVQAAKEREEREQIERERRAGEELLTLVDDAELASLRQAVLDGCQNDFMWRYCQQTDFRKPAGRFLRGMMRREYDRRRGQPAAQTAASDERKAAMA